MDKPKFAVQITNEATGENILNITGIEEFMVLTKKGQDLTRSFSTIDTILQLGMLKFAEQKVREEITGLPEHK